MPDQYTLIAICSPGYEFDVQGFDSAHKDKNLCEIVMPMPKEIRDAKNEFRTADEAKLYGHNWYSWAWEYWGTKWGTYNAKAFKLDGDKQPVLLTFNSS